MLKGKYFQSEGAKNGFLTNYAVLEIKDLPYAAPSKLEIYNADSSTVCMIAIPITGTIKGGQAVLDITKTISYLKPFNSEVDITISDFITICCTSSSLKKATLPKVLSHEGMGLIARMINFADEWDYNDVTSALPTFSRTTFDNCIQVLASDIVPIAKSCEVVGVARYKFDYRNHNDTDLLTISSKKTEVEQYEGSLSPLGIVGEYSTVEFTGNFHKFLNGLVRIYMKDDAPILMVCQNRMLLKAPYLSG